MRLVLFRTVPGCDGLRRCLRLSPLDTGRNVVGLSWTKHKNETHLFEREPPYVAVDVLWSNYGRQLFHPRDQKHDWLLSGCCANTIQLENVRRPAGQMHILVTRTPAGGCLTQVVSVICERFLSRPLLWHVVNCKIQQFD